MPKTVNVFCETNNGSETRVDICDNVDYWNMQISLSPAGKDNFLTFLKSQSVFDLSIAVKMMEVHKGFFVYKSPDPLARDSSFLRRIFTNLSAEEAKNFFTSAGYNCSATILVENHDLVTGMFSLIKEGGVKNNVIIVREGVELSVKRFYEFLDINYIDCPADAIYYDSTEEVSLFGKNSVDVKVKIDDSRTLEFSVPYLLSKYHAWQLVSRNAGFILRRHLTSIGCPVVGNVFESCSFKSYSVFGSDEQKASFKGLFGEGYECIKHSTFDDSEFIAEDLIFQNEEEKVQVRIMKEGACFDSSGSLDLPKVI